MIAPVVLAAIYVVAWVRQPLAHRRPWHLVAMMAGMVALAAAFLPATEAAADRSFTGHMVQHLLLLFAVPVLVALAMPITVGSRALGWRLTHPVGGIAPLIGGFVGVAVVLVVNHVPEVYDATVRSDALHSVSHLAYLAGGCAFWWAVMARDRVVFNAGHGVRILAVIALQPLMALMAASIGSADHIIYPSLATSTADQETGAALMWLVPTVVWFPVLIWLVLDWARSEEATERRLGGVIRA